MESSGSAALTGASKGFMSGAISGAILGGIGGGIKGPQCFVAGTKVLSAKGHVNIEDIQAGDYVWATNPETGETALKKVVRTFVNETDTLVHVKTNDEEITTTLEHPFYVEGKEWTGAGELKEGDKLTLITGETVSVQNVIVERCTEPVKVYNFEVEDFHTYYVGHESVLVHNMCAKGGSSPKGVGNPVKIAGKGSTGRTIPNSLNEQMAMHQVKSNPLSGAKELTKTVMKDSRWPASKGWVKMQSVVKTSDGEKTTIHFVYNKISGLFDDFKFK